MYLPPEFVQNVTVAFDDGAAWLARLPDLLTACVQRYDLSLGEPFNLSFNYVTGAMRLDGTEVVLKVGVPNPELTTEILALQRYDGDGMVRLLDSDPDAGVLVLERLRPGTMLAILPDDDTATEIAATLMRRLWRPVEADHLFHTVADWGRRAMGQLRAQYDGGTGPFDRCLVEFAEATYLETAQRSDVVLLHGDLHHENVLAATREPWLAIDPKGVVGPRGYECGTFLRNQLVNKPNPAKTNVRRVDILAEVLGLEREEVLRWGITHNIMSAWWAAEDGEIVYDDGLVCARLCGKQLGVGP